MCVNSVCNELDITWIESGVSEDAVSGHIQYIEPGRTACYRCVPPLIVAAHGDEHTLKREGVCAASLPTTMAVIAGLLVQNALKYVLEFGRVAAYLGYNALTDYFPTQQMLPNPACDDVHCVRRQAEVSSVMPSARQRVQKRGKPARQLDHTGNVGASNTAVTHTNNDWGIEVVDESNAQAGDNGASPAMVTSGLRFAYEHPVRMPGAHALHARTEYT
jgi:ubiquitin-like modifier-activating enzyme 5